MLDRFRNLSEIFKNFAIFAVVIIGGAYFILNIWGNIALNIANKPPEDSYPSVSKAPYQFTLRTTGQIIFAKNYETVADGIYRLNSGHYEDRGGRWVWVKYPLPLDEKIWGEIEVKRR